MKIIMFYFKTALCFNGDAKPEYKIAISYRPSHAIGSILAEFNEYRYFIAAPIARLHAAASGVRRKWRYYPNV
jgi:hypothetical protein